MNTFEMRRAECQIQMLGEGYWVAFVEPDSNDLTQGGWIEIFSNEDVATGEFVARQVEFGMAKLGQFSISKDGDLEIVPIKGILNFDGLVNVLHENGMFTNVGPEFVAETLNEKQRVRLFSEIVTGAIIVDKSQDQDSHA